MAKKRRFGLLRPGSLPSRKDCSLVRRPKSDPLDFLTTPLPAQLDRLTEDILRDHKARLARKVLGISEEVEKMSPPDEPDEWAIAARNVKARREHVARLVAEALKANQKTAHKSNKLHRKKLRLTKFEIAVLNAARLTEVQEKYMQLHLEGRTVTEIARMCTVHHSTVQDSLRAAKKKVEWASSDPHVTRFRAPYRKNS